LICLQQLADPFSLAEVIPIAEQDNQRLPKDCKNAPEDSIATPLITIRLKDSLLELISDRHEGSLHKHGKKSVTSEIVGGHLPIRDKAYMREEHVAVGKGWWSDDKRALLDCRFAHTATKSSWRTAEMKKTKYCAVVFDRPDRRAGM